MWEVAGYHSRLVSGLRELGCSCSFVTLTAHAYAYGEREPVNRLLRFLQDTGLRLELTSWARPHAKLFWLCLWVGLRELVRLPLFLWALCRHDVFIFRAMFPFLFYFDLPILKLFGKRVIWVFHGTESRPPYLNGKLMRRPGRRVLRTAALLGWLQKHLIRFAERYVDVMVNSPATGQFHEKPFVQFLALGIPCRSPDAPETRHSAEARRDSAPTRVLHCPSHAATKGSAEIRRAVEELREEGLDLELSELSGVPNQAILEALEEVDFVIDQVYSDTPMAGFPTEAAFRGKAAVVGGYYTRRLHDDVPAEFIPPSLFCAPEELKDAIRALVTDPEKRRRLGENAYRFVTENWGSRVVAERFLRLCTDEIPETWYYDPARLRYLHGYGMPEDLLRKRLGELVARTGRETLRLKDKPELEAAFLAFIEETDGIQH